MFIFGTKNLKITGNGNGSLLSESRLSSPGNVRESCSKAEIASGVTRLAALVLLLLFFLKRVSLISVELFYMHPAHGLNIWVEFDSLWRIATRDKVIVKVHSTFSLAALMET